MCLHPKHTRVRNMCLNIRNTLCRVRVTCCVCPRSAWGAIHHAGLSSIRPWTTVLASVLPCHLVSSLVTLCTFGCFTCSANPLTISAWSEKAGGKDDAGVSPPVARDPAGHGTHAVMPVLSAYVPGAQSVQSCAPPIEYVPLSQSEHVMAPPAQPHPYECTAACVRVCVWERWTEEYYLRP